MNTELPVEIILIRPGATDLDQQGRITGTLDVPLNETGFQQAASLSENAARFDLQAIYSSPSVAARETAKAIAKPKKIRVRVVEQLRAIDQGLWQGKELEELRATQPKVARQWEEHPETICPPGGEPLESAMPRLVKFLKKIHKKHKGQSIAMVVADPLASLIAACLKLRSDNQGGYPDYSLTVVNDCGTLEALSLSNSGDIDADWLLAKVPASAE